MRHNICLPPKANKSVYDNVKAYLRRDLVSSVFHLHPNSDPCGVFPVRCSGMWRVTVHFNGAKTFFVCKLDFSFLRARAASTPSYLHVQQISGSSSSWHHKQTGLRERLLCVSPRVLRLPPFLLFKE